ncbi:hypothetical protein QYF36_007455 [Acer negundo]|nr:hypothetical protein QYF36_007455 [Acer negundo]
MGKLRIASRVVGIMESVVISTGRCDSGAIDKEKGEVSVGCEANIKGEATNKGVKVNKLDSQISESLGSSVGKDSNDISMLRKGRVVKASGGRDVSVKADILLGLWFEKRMIEI